MAGRTLALLGDSILDNAPYTGLEPDTATHLQRLLEPDWDVRLLARDGAVMRDVPHQLRRLGGRPDLAVLSIGGNDAIEHIGLLDRHASGSAEVLDELLGIVDAFAQIGRASCRGRVYISVVAVSDNGKDRRIGR